MKSIIEIKIAAFEVPEYVYGSITKTHPDPRPAKPADPDLVRPGPALPAVPPQPSGPTAFPIVALDAETLERLCDDFRDEVFRMAGKRRPPQAART